jgi:hypothetical protein
MRSRYDLPPTLLQRPTRTHQHGSISGSLEGDRPLAADVGWNLTVQGVREWMLHRQQVWSIVRNRTKYRTDPAAEQEDLMKTVLVVVVVIAVCTGTA